MLNDTNSIFWVISEYDPIKTTLGARFNHSCLQNRMFIKEILNCKTAVSNSVYSKLFGWSLSLSFYGQLRLEYLFRLADLVRCVLASL